MDRIKVVVKPDADGIIPHEDDLLAMAKEAGWTDDPLEGRCILIDDERGNPGYEVFNPIPIAPPIGYEPTPPIEELIRSRVRDEFAKLKDEMEIDSVDEIEDFDEPDESGPLETIYEFAGMELEAPDLKPAKVSDDERAKADAEYAELVEVHRRRAKARNRAEYEKRLAEARSLIDADAKEEGAP